MTGNIEAGVCGHSFIDILIHRLIQIENSPAPIASKMIMIMHIVVIPAGTSSKI
jgi:hypothetical protein